VGGGSRRLRASLIGLLLAFTIALGGIAGLVLVVTNRAHDNLASGLQISYPTNGQLVGTCTEVRGRGSIPHGYKLWVFIGINGVKGQTNYWPVALAATDGDSSHWKAPAPEVHVGMSGDKELSATISAVLIGDQWSQYLEASNARGVLYSTVLPAGAHRIEPIGVVRKADPNNLTCNTR